MLKNIHPVWLWGEQKARQKKKRYRKVKARTTFTCHAWWCFEELSVEILNHHITLLCRLHSVVDKVRDKERDTGHSI
jgi:hypothetical protein